MIELDAIRSAGRLRTLTRQPEGTADFCSNDFFGFGMQKIEVSGNAGATGSRLISGTGEALEAFEAWAAELFGSETALFFPSGYQANLALMQALGSDTRRDVLLMDAAIHASLRDGATLSGARKVSYAHGDLEALEGWLKKLAGKGKKVSVVTETVFSMSGRESDLTQMAELCARYGAAFVTDEAHAVGLCGDNWLGMGNNAALRSAFIGRVIPLGKAPGAQGALLCCTTELKEVIVNTARAFIYSTAPSGVLVSLAKNQLNAVIRAEGQRRVLKKNLTLIDHLGKSDLKGHLAPIQYLVKNPKVSWEASQAMVVEQGLWVKPIRYPTVGRSEEGYRITHHSHNTAQELERLRFFIHFVRGE
jgi:8-amino-7-oxononanoate synthase